MMFVFLVIFLSLSNVSLAFTAVTSGLDTGGTANEPFPNSEANFHFSFTYGRANFNTRTGVVTAYTKSGYPYHIISQADPGAKAGQPVLYSFTIEKNLSSAVFVGLQYSAVLNQRVTGSNWIGAIENRQEIPVERFDVKEIYSSKFVNGTVNYIPVPVDFVNSRLEAAFGAGISFNMLKVTGMQRYERRADYYIASDDTSAAFKQSKNGFGLIFAGSMDFYWSRKISNQFRMEYRVTPNLTVHEQTLTYVTTRGGVRVIDKQTLKKHSIHYSGIIMSFSFRFHI